MRRSVYFCINRNFVTTSFLAFLIIDKTYYIITLCAITNFSIVIYLRFLVYIDVLKTKLSIIEISLYLITSFVFTCRK